MDDWPPDMFGDEIEDRPMSDHPAARLGHDRFSEAVGDVSESAMDRDRFTPDECRLTCVAVWCTPYRRLSQG